MTCINDLGAQATQSLDPSLMVESKGQREWLLDLRSKINGLLSLLARTVGISKMPQRQRPVAERHNTAILAGELSVERTPLNIVQRHSSLVMGSCLFELTSIELDASQSELCLHLRAGIVDRGGQSQHLVRNIERVVELVSNQSPDKCPHQDREQRCLLTDNQAEFLASPQRHANLFGRVATRHDQRHAERDL